MKKEKKKKKEKVQKEIVLKKTVFTGEKAGTGFGLEPGQKKEKGPQETALPGAKARIRPGTEQKQEEEKR